MANSWMTGVVGEAAVAFAPLQPSICGQVNGAGDQAAASTAHSNRSAESSLSECSPNVMRPGGSRFNRMATTVWKWRDASPSPTRPSRRQSLPHQRDPAQNLTQRRSSPVLRSLLRRASSTFRISSRRSTSPFGRRRRSSNDADDSDDSQGSDGLSEDSVTVSRFGAASTEEAMRRRQQAGGSCSSLDVDPVRARIRPMTAEGAKAMASQRAKAHEELYAREVAVRAMWRQMMGDSPGIAAEISKMRATERAKQCYREWEVERDEAATTATASAEGVASRNRVAPASVRSAAAMKAATGPSSSPLDAVLRHAMADSRMETSDCDADGQVRPSVASSDDGSRLSHGRQRGDDSSRAPLIPPSR